MKIHTSIHMCKDEEYIHQFSISYNYAGWKWIEILWKFLWIGKNHKELEIPKAVAKEMHADAKMVKSVCKENPVQYKPEDV